MTHLPPPPPLAPPAASSWQLLTLLTLVLHALLLTTSLTDAALCPQGCECSNRGRRGTTLCMMTELTAIPAIDPNTDELLMSGHNLGVIPKGAFRNAPVLRSLVLELCGIEALEEGAFEGLANLSALNLKHNKITVLTEGMFEGLLNVMDISLDGNDIRTIGNYTFNGLRNHVMLKMENNYNLRDIDLLAFEGSMMQEVYFYNCSLTVESLKAFLPLRDSLSVFFLSNNRIPLNIPTDLFHGFQLLSLNLAHNGIQDVSFLSHVITDDLSLEYNQVGSINFTQFPTLRQTRILRLSHTLCSSMDGSMFRGMDRLSQLYLSHNDITTLPESLMEVFQHLDRLTLEGNPLHCNCELRWLRMWLMTTPSDVVLKPHCATPPALAHTAVVRTEEAQLSCEPPANIKLSQIAGDGRSTPRLSLRCSARGDPAPVISWTLPDGNMLSTSRSLDRQMRDTMGVVEVEPAGGRYVCTAHNVAGNVSREVVVDAYISEKRSVGNSGSMLHSDIACFLCGLTVLLVFMKKL